MNAVLIAVAVMLVLSLLRVNVVFALVTGALIGGVTGGLGLETTISTFSEGLGGSAVVALSYALLGGFAVALSKTGLPDAMVQMALRMVGRNGETKEKVLFKSSCSPYYSSNFYFFSKCNTYSYCIYPNFDSTSVKGVK